MSKKRTSGSLATLRSDDSAFVAVDGPDFSMDPESATKTAVRKCEQLSGYLKGSTIRLVHSSQTAYGGSVVRVFEMPDGKLGASYGHCSRDYKWA